MAAYKCRKVTQHWLELTTKEEIKNLDQDYYGSLLVELLLFISTH